MSRPDVVWIFIEVPSHLRDSWQWRKVALDGTLLGSSANILGYQSAVADAIGRGFNPREDYWVTQCNRRKLLVGPARLSALPTGDLPQEVSMALEKAGL